MSDDKSKPSGNTLADALYDEHRMLVDYLKERFGSDRRAMLAVLRSVVFDYDAVVRHDLLENIAFVRKLEDVKNGR